MKRVYFRCRSGRFAVFCALWFLSFFVYDLVEYARTGSGWFIASALVMALWLQLSVNPHIAIETVKEDSHVDREG